MDPPAAGDDVVQERYVYFPGCLKENDPAADAMAGITIFERVR